MCLLLTIAAACVRIIAVFASETWGAPDVAMRGAKPAQQLN
jgi:hypothetical protein